MKRKKAMNMFMSTLTVTFLFVEWAEIKPNHI